MKKIKTLIFCFFIFHSSNVFSENNFDTWLRDFSQKARSEGISDETIEKVLRSAQYLPQVIKYEQIFFGVEHLFDVYKKNFGNKQLFYCLHCTT